MGFIISPSTMQRVPTTQSDTTPMRQSIFGLIMALQHLDMRKHTAIAEEDHPDFHTSKISTKILGWGFTM